VNGEVRVGTSGWHYKHWRGPFYPEPMPPRDMLAFYSRHFDSVEINNSFYRLPTAAAVEEWREATPEGFCFAVKGSRFLTHMKKLKDPEAGLARFLPPVEGLGEKLGPILFQLPPRWRVDEGRLAAFLGALPACHRYSFELRDPSWHTRTVYDLLGRHNAAFCVYDIGGFQSPVVITADFTYVRLHGPLAEKYQGSYGAYALDAWAARVREWRRELKSVYFYFDNDIGGHAVQDALLLRSML
jgi:uncharacterized protein YecE (DUF72 family)